MRKSVDESKPHQDRPRRVLARVVAEELRHVQGGGSANPLDVILTGNTRRDLSDTDSEYM